MLLVQRFCSALVAAAIALCGWPPSSANAIDVTPMVTQITPTGATSSYRLGIKNTDDQPVTVEIEVYRMEVDENGVRTLTEEPNDITVFPPQSVIPPNREQVVQVRYVGEPDVGPRMYLVRVGQLPIAFNSGDEEDRGAAVQVAFNINTHVLLSPSDAEASIEVVSTRRAENGDVLIVARNPGTGFALLRQARYTLTSDDGQTIEVPAEDVVVGQVSTLPAGATRNIRIPAALAPSLGPNVTASIVLS
jgi:P pilus assembly chaperone PapD